MTGDLEKKQGRIFNWDLVEIRESSNIKQTEREISPLSPQICKSSAEPSAGLPAAGRRSLGIDNAWFQIMHVETYNPRVKAASSDFGCRLSMSCFATLNLPDNSVIFLSIWLSISITGDWLWLATVHSKRDQATSVTGWEHTNSSRHPSNLYSITFLEHNVVRCASWMKTAVFVITTQAKTFYQPISADRTLSPYQRLLFSSLLKQNGENLRAVLRR